MCHTQVGNIWFMMACTFCPLPNFLKVTKFLVYPFMTTKHSKFLVQLFMTVRTLSTVAQTLSSTNRMSNTPASFPALSSSCSMICAQYNTHNSLAIVCVRAAWDATTSRACLCVEPRTARDPETGSPLGAAKSKGHGESATQLEAM